MLQPRNIGFAGRGRRPRLFYSVVRASERYDKWINLHGAVERMDETGSEDGLFGAVEQGADSLIGQIERLTQGGKEGRERTIEELKQKADELRKTAARPPEKPE